MSTETFEVKDYDNKPVNQEVTMQRDHFIVNSIESEFNWLLHQLGVPEDEHQHIEKITFTVDKINHIEPVEP